jgi:RNA polymerase I-specific transcription initiation factor RRN3
MDLPPHPKSPSLDGFAKRSPRTRQSPGASKKLTSSLPSKSPTPLLDGDLPRPIATNGRIKRGERLQKDMYLAFVNNALEQKTLVRPSPVSHYFSYLSKVERFLSHAGE